MKKIIKFFIFILLLSAFMTGINVAYAEEEKNITILQQPVDYYATHGTATFTVEVLEKDVTYQWQYKMPGTSSWVDSDATGYDTNTIKIRVLERRNGQAYRCVISDGINTVYSDEAYLTYEEDITILQQPIDYYATRGTATFTVKVAEEDVTYQWQYKMPGTSSWIDSDATGYDTNTMKIHVLERRNGQAYRCAISAGTKTIYSDVAFLYYEEKSLVIIQQPENNYKIRGTARFTVKVSKDAVYQWQYQTLDSTLWIDSDATGYNTNTLKVPVSKKLDGQAYRCIISDGVKTIYSDVVYLYYKDSPLLISKQPIDYYGISGMAKFTVEASQENVTYQWQYQRQGTLSWVDSVSTGCKTNTVILNGLERRDGQAYRCVVSDGKETVYSDTVYFYFEERSLFIVQQPENYYGTSGIAEFKVETSKDAIYQWQFRMPDSTWWTDSDATGCKTDTLKISVLERRSGQAYRCVISDGEETIYSDAAYLYYKENPLIIVQQPENYYGTSGTAEFTVETSQEDVTFQWQYQEKDSTVWVDSTSAGCETDTIQMPVSESLNGQAYRCVISDGMETVYSDAAYLYYKENPINIVQQPENYFGTSGIAVFTVEASQEDVTYRWQYHKDGSTTWIDSTLTGCKTNTIQIYVSDRLDGQAYRCVISDGIETVYSETAYLYYVEK